MLPGGGYGTFRRWREGVTGGAGFEGYNAAPLQAVNTGEYKLLPAPTPTPVPIFFDNFGMEFNFI